MCIYCRDALTCTLLWLRISQLQAKAHSRFWKDPDHGVRIHPDAWSAIGSASQCVAEGWSQTILIPSQPGSEHWRGMAEQRAATDSADQELSDQQSCDVSVLWFRPGRVELQNYTNADAWRWVCMLVFLTTPNFSFKQCAWKPMH